MGSTIDLAFVPPPPSYISSSEVESTSSGEVYFGQISSINGSILSITTSSGTLEINGATSTSTTLTTSTNLQSVSVGEYVEVNGPEVSSTEYTGHQINIGLTPYSGPTGLDKKLSFSA